MAEIIPLGAKPCWPKLKVITTEAGFNKSRGRHFYVDVNGHVKGPFMSKLSASLDILRTHPNSGVPMRTAFEQDDVWWWKKDTETGVQIQGPYHHKAEAEAAINNHVQDMKDLAGHDRYR